MLVKDFDISITVIQFQGHLKNLGSNAPKTVNEMLQLTRI